MNKRTLEPVTPETVCWPAVRAFTRLFTPIAQAQSMAEACDAHYDGGEWSGPAHDRIYNDLWNNCCYRTARRFRIPPTRLAHMILTAGYHEEQCAYNARRAV
jgi:hypothetical protein